MLRGEHAAFTDTSYPAHLTALLAVDLRRMAAECGLAAGWLWSLRGHTGKQRQPPGEAPNR